MSETPTARELLTELDRKHWHPGPIKDLASRVEAALALHVGRERQVVLRKGPAVWQTLCEECGKPWPCPTRRALEGEK